MSVSLWFVVPAHGRFAVSRVCLRQLARTCDDLAVHGVRASAVVVACDDNLDVAADLGFATVERDNKYLGRRFNDGYELACRAGVDYVVPVGTDDWVDAAWIADSLPDADTIRCSRQMSMVSEDGSRISTLSVPYVGGHGIRVIPTPLLAACNGRPAGEDRMRAIDTSTLQGISVRNGGQPALAYVDRHPFQLVDWKSPDEQLNGYEACGVYRVGDELTDPFAALEGLYPQDALDEMRAVYERVMV